jgi:beta-RFAP synthase
MIAEPALVLHVRPAKEWSAEGPRAERALAFARQFASTFPADTIPPHHLTIEAAPPEHAGLGSGTQLGLAVARALSESAGVGTLDVTDLARRVGRGKRSAIGIHGFAHGGFLVEAGKRAPEEISPLIARADFPEEWPIVLAIPESEPGLHGSTEVEAFRRLHRSGVPLPTEALCRLVLHGMVPSIAERDLSTFGDALYEFNHKVGEAFASVQGGPYAGPRVTAIVDWLRKQGIRGVAQSSWGPAVCGIVEESQADRIVADLRSAFHLDPAHAFAVKGWNVGALGMRS